MKIESRMIDKQLRMPAKFLKLILKSPSKEEFLRLHKNLAKLRGKKFKGLQCSEKWIPGGQDHAMLRISIYKPLILSGEATAGVLWMHGGGYAMGVPESSIGLIRSFIKECGCTVIAPDYRLSLDSPYPAALEDCHEALLWMKNHARELGIRDDQLMVGGESAGGGLAVALSLYERDLGGVEIAFQMPLYPMLDDRMITESAKENNAPVWDSEANRVAWALYLVDLEGKDVPIYAAPARATDYSGLPPAVTFVGDLEPFRDETLQFVSNLREAEVPVVFELFEGCYHAFDRMNPYAEVSKKARSLLMASFHYAVQNYFAEQHE